MSTQHELAALASRSIAGWKILKQATVSATNAANTTYTVTEEITKRVAFIVIGTTDGDIRFEHNAAATATDVPLVNAAYVTLEAKKNDTVEFWNTTGSPITVNVVELA